LEKWLLYLVQGWGWGKYKMILEHLFISKSKRKLKKVLGTYQNSLLEGVPSDQILG